MQDKKINKFKKNHTQERRFQLKRSTNGRVDGNTGTADTLRTVVRMVLWEQCSSMALWMRD